MPEYEACLVVTLRKIANCQVLQLLDMWKAHVGEEIASPTYMIAILQRMPLTQDIIDEIKKKCI